MVQVKSNEVILERTVKTPDTVMVLLPIIFTATHCTQEETQMKFGKDASCGTEPRNERVCKRQRVCEPANFDCGDFSRPSCRPMPGFCHTEILCKDVRVDVQLECNHPVKVCVREANFDAREFQLVKLKFRGLSTQIAGDKDEYHLSVRQLVDAQGFSNQVYTEFETISSRDRVRVHQGKPYFSQ